MNLTEAGMVTLVSRFKKNALLPMFVTEFGIVTLVS
jgi:hypothetical protein